MVDTHDLKSCAFMRAGSSPAGGSSPRSIITGSIAQLVEHLPYKQNVSGSSPFTPNLTIF